MTRHDDAERDRGTVRSGKQSEAPGRFFQTMVLMGGSLALGCGGETQHSADAPADGSGDATADTTGATSVGTVGPTTTASVGTTLSSGSTGTTGSSSVSGSGAGGSAGTSSNAGGTGGTSPIEPWPFACASEQLVCPSDVCADSGDGHLLSADCECDDTRPSVAEDCETGTTMACLLAVASADGREFTEPIAVGCKCVAGATDCDSVCRAFEPGGYRSCLGTKADILGDPGGFLCGCSVTILK